MNKVVKAIIIVLILNFILISLSITSGFNKGNIKYRFQERQAVTFISALLLGGTSLVSLIIFLIKKKIQPSDKGVEFWLLSSIGFLYLCMDEYFMAHEGIDNIVANLFVKQSETLRFDGITLGIFALIALVICFCYKNELLKQRKILPFLILGGVCFLGTVVFDQLYLLESLSDVVEVIEESFKILAVSFFFTGYLMLLLFIIKRIPTNIINKERKT